MSAPYVPNLFRRTYKVKNKKRKNLYVTKVMYYYWWIDENGEKHFASTGCENLAEAKEMIKNIIETQVLGKVADETTLAEYAEPFFKEKSCPILKDKKERKKDYSPDFARWTRGQIEKHIINDDIGNEKLTGLTPYRIQCWLNGLPEEYKIRNATANKQVRYLSQILEMAVLQGRIPMNPCSKVKRLPDDSRKRPAFTEDEIKALFSEPWDDIFSYVACIVAADTGLRISEVRALKPSAIKETTLKISNSYARSGEKSTKNKSVNEIPVSPTVRNWLLKLAEGLGDDEYIFALDGKKPLENNLIYESFYKMMEVKGIDRNKYKNEDPENMLPLSFHSFRHALNTILLDHGVMPEKVRAILRHKTPSMTEHYTNSENFSFDDVRAVQSILMEKKDA